MENFKEKHRHCDTRHISNILEEEDMAEANRIKYLRSALLAIGIVAQTGTLSAQEAVKHLNPVIEKLAAGKPFIGFQSGDLSFQTLPGCTSSRSA